MKAKRKTNDEEDASRCFPKLKWMSCFRRKRANRNRPELDDDDERAGTMSGQESIIDMMSTTSTVRNWTTVVSSSSSDSSAGVDPAVTFEQTVTIDESARRDGGDDDVNPIAVTIAIEPPAKPTIRFPSPSPTPSSSVSSDFTDTSGSSDISFMSDLSRASFQYYISTTPSPGSILSPPTPSPEKPFHICSSTWSAFHHDTPSLPGSTDIRTTPVPPRSEGPSPQESAPSSHESAPSPHESAPSPHESAPSPHESASRESSPTKPGPSDTAQSTPDTPSPVVFRGQAVEGYAIWIGGEEVLVNVIPGHPTKKELKCGRMYTTPVNFHAVARHGAYHEAKRDQVNMAIELLNRGILEDRECRARHEWNQNDENVSWTSDDTPPAVNANQATFETASTTSQAEKGLVKLDDKIDSALSTPVKRTPVENYVAMVGNERAVINIIPHQRSSKDLDIAPNYWTPVISPDPHMDTAYLKAARDILGKRLLDHRLRGDRKGWKRFLRKMHTGKSKWLNTAYEGRLPDRPSIGSSLFQAANGETRVRRESQESRRASRVVDTRVEIRPTPPRVGILGRISRFFRSCFRQGDRQ